MRRVGDKAAIVTGAARGIGYACARLLAQEGARVVLADIDDATGKAAARSIAEDGGEATFLRLDVSKEDDWKSVIDATVRLFGNLDVLVNNAAVQRSKPLNETTLDDWRAVFAVNVEGIFLGTRIAMDRMKSRRGGSIVNISSTMAMVVNELSAAYCASKAAVTHFTKAAALDGALGRHPVRVNSVHPGIVRTEMILREIEDVARQRGDPTPDLVRDQWEKLCPLGMQEPEDIATAVLYLSSDESRRVTGSELVVDGGHIIGRRKLAMMSNAAAGSDRSEDAS